MLALPVVLLSLVVVALTRTVDVDDRDSRIVYTGNWTTGGASDEFQGTTSYTFDRGATFLFTFTGTALQIIGSQDGALPNPTGLMSFRLDEGTETSFDATVAENARITNVVFFATTGLALGEHKILVTNQGGKLVIDKIVYEEPDSTTTNPPPPTDTTTAPPGGTTPAPTTTPSTSDTGGATETVTDTNTSTRTKQTPTSSTRSATSSAPSSTNTSAASSTLPNLAVIVGASVGGVGALALIFLAVVIIKKRRHPSSPSSEKIDLEVQQTYPLMATPPPQSSSTAPYDPFASGPNRDLSASAAPSQTSIAGQAPVRPADELGYDTSLLQYLDNPSQPTPPTWGASPPTPGYSQGREGTPYTR